MGWKDALTEQTKGAYAAAEGLISLLSEEDLGWKPASGENWMTVGQLLEHLVESCGLLTPFAAQWLELSTRSYPERSKLSIAVGKRGKKFR